VWIQAPVEVEAGQSHNGLRKQFAVEILSKVKYRICVSNGAMFCICISQQV
jgi:hypothetical protein